MFVKRLQIILVVMLIAIMAFSNMRASALAPLPQDNMIIAYHPLTGMASFMGPSAAGRLIREATALEKNSTNEEVARSFLAVEGSKFGITDARNNLSVLRETKTEYATSTIRFQQTYQGIPILAGEMIVHMDSQKNVLSASGEILPNIELDIAPVIDEATAIQTALEATAKENNVNTEDLQASAPELWIYNPALLTPYKGETVLSWRLEINPKASLLPIRQLVLVEAKHGGIVLSFNQVDTAKNRLTYNAGGKNVLPGTLVCNESNPTCTGGTTDAINAHVYAGQTYDFYMDNHGRDSIDGSGMDIISVVNFGGFSNPNAEWDGTQMKYSPGFASADDVVGHELTHGVTEHESGLLYYYQSGAINESFSDVWGEFIDLGNGMGADTSATRWQIGEDLPASIGVIRNMQDPTIYNDPDKMTSSNYKTGPSDSGGVHSNSGVNNKAVYLMVDGATFNGKTVTALGITKVAKIYYYAQANLLVSGSDYADLYYALKNSCSVQIDTFGISAADCQEVLDAIDAVEMNLQPVGACVGDSNSLLFTTQDNEDSAGNKVGDCDMDAYLYNYAPIQPIEFTIKVPSGSNISKTDLLLKQWDVDETSGEVDKVYFNGNYVGTLTGANNTWSTTFLSLTPSWVVPGDNLVRIDIDVTDAGWAVQTDWGQIILNGVTSGTANVSATNLNQVEYKSGDKVQVDVAVDTLLSSQNVQIEINLRDPLGTILAGVVVDQALVSKALVGNVSAPVTVGLNIPTQGPSGTYDIQVLVYDKASNLIQDYKVVPFHLNGTYIFYDVPSTYWAWSYIERFYKAGITSGCSASPLTYCPLAPATRAQMAIFILRGIHGKDYIPPAATGTIFSDVSINTFGAAWIEQFAKEGITSGCGGGKYCPNDNVTRAQMAIFLLKGKYGSAYIPPVATGVFSDVPVGSFGADWIEQLATEGITSGCGGGKYCPNTNVTRDQMAVFLVKTFNLP